MTNSATSRPSISYTRKATSPGSAISYLIFVTGLNGLGKLEIEFVYTSCIGEINSSFFPFSGAGITDQWGNPLNYTSGKVTMKSKISIKYGVIEFRVKVPDLNLGGWPAVWLLGTANYV